MKTIQAIISICLICSVLILWNCQEQEYVIPPTMELPDEMPFELVRPDAGEPVSDEAITAFTKKITAAWKDVDYFDWLSIVTYGVEKDNPENMPYYACWWTGSLPTKEDNKVTFTHTANHSSDNVMIVQSIHLLNVMGGHRLSGNSLMGQLSDELARGVSSTMMGMVWDENVPLEDQHIMARYIIGNNYELDLGNNRLMAVDYTDWRQNTQPGVFSESIHVENNPYWGDIWARAKRSKDDICSLFRMTAFLPFYFGELNEEAANQAIYNLYRDMQAFARDVVDSGYKIRTRDGDGNIYIPSEDFASFVNYGLEAECTARLSAALLGYEENLGIDCGNGIVSWYENIATTTHFYNFHLIRAFHMAAFMLSILYQEDQAAYNLGQGLIERMDSDMEKTEGFYEDPDKQENYNAKLAGALVEYAACGLPLTSKEVRLIHQYYEESIEVWNDWEYWDLWSDSIPDGQYYEGHYNYNVLTEVPFQDMAAFLHLCDSPFYNETVAKVVDCNIIRDPSQWGE